MNAKARHRKARQQEGWVREKKQPHFFLGDTMKPSKTPRIITFEMYTAV